MTHALLILFAYLVGSIPIGVLLARLKGKDPRKIGSGNIGATNVMRSAGKVLGIITLIGDILKGFIPTFIAMRLGDAGSLSSPLSVLRYFQDISSRCF